ncbi:uncharacterized protein FTOL_13214 [Fusarium torulosum]|uniref:F-box domain-containing protein n=1 Tax=Fusarium torulosum TaxID=33205 RepID=A0AAE8SPP8_9HYPO|nr:uncharacterized protein FTOL_13214 [Fusarium torulosum]
MSFLSPPLSLTTLPSEIQNEIISLLDSFDKLILRTTSRHFRTITPITTDDLLTTEQTLFSRENDLLGCYDCLCLRRAACFADNMRKGKRGRQGSKPTLRFCIDCGLNPHSAATRYNHGNMPQDSFDENRWVCNPCWQLVARRRREKEREQQNMRYRQEKVARAKVRAKRRARLRDLGWAESEIEDRVSDVEDFPIPADLLEQIDIARQDYLDKIFSATYDLLDRMPEELECSYECSSMLLGVFTKELKKHGVLSPRGAQPFYGFSIGGSKDISKGCKVPRWYGGGVSGRYGSGYSCTIQQKLSLTLQKAENELRGFGLQDFQLAKSDMRPFKNVGAFKFECKRKAT